MGHIMKSDIITTILNILSQQHTTSTSMTDMYVYVTDTTRNLTCSIEFMEEIGDTIQCDIKENNRENYKTMLLSEFNSVTDKLKSNDMSVYIPETDSTHKVTNVTFNNGALRIII